MVFFVAHDRHSIVNLSTTTGREHFLLSLFFIHHTYLAQWTSCDLSLPVCLSVSRGLLPQGLGEHTTDLHFLTPPLVFDPPHHRSCWCCGSPAQQKTKLFPVTTFKHYLRKHIYTHMDALSLGALHKGLRWWSRAKKQWNWYNIYWWNDLSLILWLGYICQYVWIDVIIAYCFQLAPNWLISGYYGHDLYAYYCRDYRSNFIQPNVDSIGISSYCD